MLEGDFKRLHHVTFTVRPGSLDQLRDALARAGAPVIEPPPGASEDGLWTVDPDGTPVQLLDIQPAQPRAIAEVPSNVGANRQRIGVAAWREVTEDVLPRRLGHSLFFTGQPA